MRTFLQFENYHRTEQLRHIINPQEIFYFTCTFALRVTRQTSNFNSTDPIRKFNKLCVRFGAMYVKRPTDR